MKKYFKKCILVNKFNFLEFLKKVGLQIFEIEKKHLKLKSE